MFYSEQEVDVVGRTILNMQSYLSQQLNLRKGLKEFGDKGVEVCKAELGQMHDIFCWKTIAVKELTRREKQCAQEGLMLLTRKCGGKVKSR